MLKKIVVNPIAKLLKVCYCFKAIHLPNLDTFSLLNSNYYNHIQKACFIFLVMFCSLVSTAQEKFTGYFEPYLELEYDLTETYSHKFTLENRVRWYDQQGLKIDVTQFDLAHFSGFKLNDKNAIAIGIQYRFEEYFNTDEENELRFTQQYKYTSKYKAAKIQHRLRAEQRISASLTSHRYRYKFKIISPFKISQIVKSKPHFIGSLETLLTVADGIDPKYEQRAGIGIGWSLTDFADLELVTEYRLDDFTKNLGHELFVVTGITFTP